MQASARGLAFSSSPVSSSTKRVFIDLSSALLRSSFRGWEKSFSALVPSGPYKPQKGEKISEQERRALVESFVDKYRASNAGRFPPVSHVRQEIGGSYYIIKQLVQEMKYNKRSSLNGGAHHLTKAEDVDQSSSAKKVPFTSAVDNMLKTDVGDKQDESSVSLKLDIGVDAMQSPSGETIGSRTEKSANDIAHDASFSKVVEHNRGKDEVLETEEHLRDHPRSTEQSDSSARTTDLWGNLRLLADGIVSFWRKM
ncbi:unnamed protein product [Musa acuminata subsp. malaccensis]|uniref:(wild Malaysian banana) hypothetical protein n=1 Tax=Musa acuminata subsp. malaccensis TaxID=214687 RepID=A0A804ISR3_MUSAM|nr:PREDICTED: uncharacterized protein LOC103976963 isoform X1 [Musa acuminata subsp. malaccensis]XP_009390620.1 PREDICTED: uncharacterized protein LOC103976963 isoform X1 [Musa acuminata subsp. malaccensis]XP_009390628.1 PREDICTED: uncharacterized protein LOC103976963 isoform X1 [Musa acuminata subsp. malaccensis]XP_018677863.1 PREDICTED: uncharacterized protein LOC103976963 isoform X1 [Musa acuminata subsp. malaccensis]CAG1843080.1 unnamed protein product [Musa acuminata subsp. malaccensis]